MRKSNNYYKFLNYVSVGNWYTSTICKDNGVLECKSYSRVSYIEEYSKLYHCVYEKTILNSDAELTFKNVLVNNEVIYIYYLTDVGEILIDAFILDNCNTQKELRDEINKKVVEFFLNNESFCEHEEATEDYNEEVTEDSVEYDEISDRQESTERDRINYLMGAHSKQYSYREVEKVCGDCSHFNACMQGYQTVAPTCCMFDSLYKARKNPKWHHVSLATLANLDFDMLDEKRHIYLTLYRDWMKTRKNLSKCKYIESYEKCRVIFARKYRKLLYDGRISKAMCNFLDRKISMLNLECGLWSSAVEVAMGQHPSRKYNRATLRY